jgi:CheY-like chemotaxis protein
MGKKILVVEDNDKNRRLITDILNYYGYVVMEAANGEEGINLAREFKPDLIFMDMQMPIMDGFTAIKILKNDPTTKHIKIIAITSFAMVGDKERILSAGADEYIPKPVNTMELPARVEKLLGKQ